MATQYESQLAAFDQASENYIGQLFGQAQGDRDFAIRMLTRDHELAVGNNDAQTAAFLEKVSDKLEEKIGRIPYDYEISSKRTSEDLARTEEVTKRNKDLALKRLSEDEQAWREDFAKTATNERQFQAEELSKRGLLTGKRGEISGVGSRDVANLEGDINSTISAYDRELGRTRGDINTQAEDILFEARTGAARTQEDLKTGARRGVIDANDAYSFGSEAENRRLQARKQELERQLANLKLQGTTYATLGAI